MLQDAPFGRAAVCQRGGSSPGESTACQSLKSAAVAGPRHLRRSRLECKAVLAVDTAQRSCRKAENPRPFTPVGTHPGIPAQGREAMCKLLAVSICLAVSVMLTLTQALAQSD